MPAKKKFGEVLLAAGIITPEQLEHVLTLQKGKNKRLGKVLVELGYVTEAQVAETLSSQLSIPLVDWKNFTMTKEMLSLVPKDIAESRTVLPFELKEKRLVLAMADPLDWKTIDDILFMTGLKVSVAVSTETEILNAIEKHYVAEEKIWDLLTGLPAYEKAEFVKQVEEKGDRDLSIQSLYKLSEAPPVVKLVTMVLVDAVKSRASDVHIEPREDHVQVRYRVDGELKNALKYPKRIQESVISRIKIISNLDITNRRLPQDGRSTLMLEDKGIDLRISTMPSVYGENIVIRLLDRSTGLIPLGRLGMPERIVKPIVELCSQPQGMLLITGPTGSGKTTTLYAALHQLKAETENIITVEDPIEYKLTGIIQVGVNEAIGLTFPVALRSILRQDPDIIMVGEIRDLDTAEIAVRAALTGHFVLSTVHTNDTVATITRLIDIGLEPFLVTSAVTGILAQRLIRKICPACRAETEISEEFVKLEAPRLKKYYKGRGCKECQYTGYRGQIGVYEFLKLSTKLKRLITKNASEEDIWDAAKEEGTASLFDNAWEKVSEGTTTVEEVIAKIPFTASRPALEPEAVEKLRVLLYDIPQGDADLMGSALSGEGYAVEREAGGDILDAVNRANPDIIAIDISAGSAQAILRLKKGNIRSASIPVLALADASVKEVEGRWLDSGISQVIYRPLNANKLHFYIDRALKRY